MVLMLLLERLVLCHIRRMLLSMCHCLCLCLRLSLRLRSGSLLMLLVLRSCVGLLLLHVLLVLVLL